MWVNGPFAPRANPDVKIFRSDMGSALRPREYDIADMGCLDDRCVLSDDPSVTPGLHTLIHARHETVNKRLKI